MDTEVITTEEMQAPPAPAPNNSKAAWIVAGVATAVALIAAMVAVSAVMRDDNSDSNVPAGFQSAGFMRPVSGKITDIDGSSFKVQETSPNGTRTTTEVETSKDTTFRESVKGALSDLGVGDTIAVSGTTADNVLTATNINETAAQTNVVRSGPGGGGPVFRSGDGSFGAQAAPPPVGGQDGPRFFQAGNGTIGKITKIEGDTITLDGFGGQSVTVKTTSTTNIRVNKTIKLSNLKVGDTVRVFGPMSGSKIAANEVTKGVTDDALAS
jgi:hypothetical protein